MRRLTIAAAAALAVALLSQPVRAEESCSGSGTPMTAAAIEAKLKSQGYTEIRDIRAHGGCYEAKGLDSAGKRFELEVNAYTGEIVNKE
jgi:hypothetical protein